MTEMLRRSLRVFADYHQFYLWDAGANPVAPEDYTDDDVKRMVKLGPNVVVLQPVRAMEVPVEVEIHDSEPGLDMDGWDHVVECSLDLPTGNLQVHECTGGPVLDASLSAGCYAVRALFGGLESLSDDGLDGDDRYKVVLWRSEPRDLRVIKAWNGERG